MLLVAGANDRVTPPSDHHEPIAAAFEAGAVQLHTRVLDADHAFSSRRIALARTVIDWLDDACAP